MNCEEVEQQDILGAYIAGKLPDAQRDLFEEHFFACEKCLQEVETARIARRVLLASKGAKPVNILLWLIPVAAVLIAAFGVWKFAPLKPSPAVVAPAPVAAQPVEGPAYEALARFDAPAYEPSTLRGSEPAARALGNAMKLYSAADYSGAAGALRAVVTAHPGLTEARFYLGISALLSGDGTSGTRELERVVDAGDTPFHSEARFYLAKALLAAKDAAGARKQLEALIQEHSELAPRASELLRRLP